MSTSKTYQQSLADASSETRPPMLERGSYIPWASRFRRYLNRKRDNRKWLLKALDEGPYVFKIFTPEGSTIPRLQTAEDLEGDDLLLHDAEMEVMNMILLSIPNEIYKDHYDDIMKNIFNSRRHKDKVGMQIPAWMITEEMKHTEHYRMTPSAPRSPNPNKEAAESSAPRRSTVIHLRIPERRSTRLTPPAPVPNVDKADEMILQDTLQVSLAEHKSREEQEARENVALVDEHLASEEIEKMVDGQENVVDDSSIPRNDESNIPGTRIEPRSNKESPEVEITKDKEVEITKETPVVDITNVVIPVNVNDEDEEITDEVYELKRREKGKIVEETRNSPIPTPIRSPRIHTNLVSSDTEKLQELTDTHTTSSSSSPHKKLAKTNRLLSLFKTKPTRFKRYKSFFQELQGRYGYLFAHLRARFMPRKSFDTLADNLHDVMVETLPTMVDKHIKEQVMKQVPEQVRNQVPVYVAEGLILERQKAKEETERLIAKAILQERGNIQAQISTQIENAIANVIPSQVDASVRSYMSGHILHVHPAQSQTSSVPDQQYQLYLAMKADPQLQQQDIAIWLALQMKFERNTIPQIACRTPAVRPRDQDDPYDDAHPKGENSAKRHKTSEYEAYVSGESLSGQVFQEEQAPSTSGNQEQDDDFDFWTDSYASDDDEIPTKQVSQDIMEEVSLTIDEAKLRKMADEMLRQRCTSGDEHQYHIDQMKNFLKSDIVWESRKEILVSPHPRKTTPLVHSCQKDPEAPALSLINQDLLYLKKGNSGPEKIVLSLHKFPAVIFNDDDIEERTSRWVNKCVKKFNPYARYGVEHWKNPHAKIFYIRKQKEPGKPKEEIYSNSKIVQVIKTYWELGHEDKFITEIVARSANKYLVSITEPDYKNLNKNDIEDIYLLIMNGKVPDYADTRLLWSLSVFIRSTMIWERVHAFQLGIGSYQQKVNLTAPTMTFPGIKDHEMFSIIYEPVHGIIYKNSKKEKRVMRHSEIHKFCDATLNRVLEGLKSYNNDIRWVEENLHIRFLENKPMIEGNGPKWLFDIDSLTQSMNYVPVVASTIINESTGTQGELNAGTSEEISQDCIVMPIWKDASYFDSLLKDVDNGEPKSAADDQKQVEDGLYNENDAKDKSDDDSSPKEVNAAGQHVNTVSPDVTTGSFKLNVVGPSVNTASLYDQDNPKDMFTMGASHTLKASHVEFFSDEDEPKVDLGNITNSYTVPTTPNTRIHKDHPVENVIGDVKSYVQTRRMIKPTSEQGFLSVVYEQKTHDTVNTCLYAYFLSQIEPTSIAKALSDSSWVEAMQEELL
ncbi:hypothetical protein Tco_1320114 [Tanacetum coccineum]